MKLAVSLYSLQLYFCTRRGVFAFSLSSRSHSGACSALCLSSHFRLGRPWVSGLARFATRVAAVEQQFFISASFGACPCYSVGWRCRCLLARRRCFAVRADSGLGSHRCLLLLQWQFAVSVSSRSQKVQLQFTQTVRLAVTCAVLHFAKLCSLAASCTVVAANVLVLMVNKAVPIGQAPFWGTCDGRPC